MAKLRLYFDHLDQPVELVDCAEIAEQLAAVLQGWRFTITGESDGLTPVITIVGIGQGYRYSARWSSGATRYRHGGDVVCAALADLFRAEAAMQSPRLCLHGSAAEFAGKLVVFPSPYRAGKSTLSAALAAAGVRLFADDVLPIDAAAGDQGMAPGVQPRLRRPLPDDASAEFRRFVAGRSGLSSERYLYLDLTRDELAPRGSLAPIGGFVLLERAPASASELVAIGKAEVLRQVIWQNFARNGDARDILERLDAIVDQAACFKLRYARAEDAAAALKDGFASWTRPAGAVPPVPAAATADASHVPAQYRRHPQVVEKVVDQDLFLVSQDRRAIFHLNPVGVAVWRLLGDRLGLDQIVELVHAAFPEVGRADIRRDIANLLDTLVAKRLVIAAPNRNAA